MNEILIGMDISGNTATSNYDYLGIVIGKYESIMRLHEPLKHLREHMASIDASDKQYVIQNLIFDSKNNVAFCINSLS